MAKSNGGTRRGNANSPNGLSSSANSVENFMSELGLKLSSEAPRDGVLGEVDSYRGEIKLSDKTKELIASALAKSGTNKELTKEEGERFSRFDIDNGVREFRRRAREGETPAKPKAYLHIDEKQRKVWYRNVKI